jgi:hypothetical protein
MRFASAKGLTKIHMDILFNGKKLAIFANKSNVAPLEVTCYALKNLIKDMMNK